MRIKILINSLKQSYLGKAFGFLSLTQAMNAITSFGVMTVYTKVLPPHDYGKISLIWLFITILTILIDTRLNTAYCIRHYKDSRADNVRNIYTILFYNLFAAAIFYGLLSTFPIIVNSLLHITVTAAEINLICLISILFVITNFMNSLLMVSKKQKSYFLVMLLFNSILIGSSAIFLFVLNYGYMAYLFAYLVAYGVASFVCLWYIFTRYRPTVCGLLSSANFKRLVKIGIPLIPDGLLLMFLAWAGRYILNLYSGLEAVGIYSVAYMFSNIFNSFIVTPMAQALSPIMFEKYATSIDDYKRLLASIFKYYWMIVLTIMIVYFTVLKEIFVVLVSPKYMGAYNVIAIIMLGITFSGAIGFMGSTIVMKEKTHKVFQITGISVTLNVILSVFLIHKLGMYGAAASMLISYVVQFALVLIYSQRLVPVGYDYRFVCSSSLIALMFGGIIFALSYLDVAPFVSMIIRYSVFSVYLLVIMKVFKLKESMKILLDRIPATVNC